MFIQTDSDNKVLGWLDQEWLDTLDDEERECVTMGYFEVDAEPEPQEGCDLYYIDGKFEARDNGEAARRAAEVTKGDLMDALADISDTVSTNADDLSTISDAIAELSELVANLASESEVSNG
jgi:hypothetical protein